MAATPPVCEFGWQAQGFALPGVDDKIYDFEAVRGPKGCLVMYICNHCPYVLAVLDRLIEDATALIKMGIGVVAINANDAAAYPQDSFDNMVRMAREKRFPFPYLYDETQVVARAYGAVCTPDFFGFNAADELQYRGRLDAARLDPPAPGTRRDLLEAMRQIAQTGQGPREQIPSMGCSIKWKA